MTTSVSLSGSVAGALLDALHPPPPPAQSIPEQGQPAALPADTHPPAALEVGSLGIHSFFGLQVPSTTPSAVPTTSELMAGTELLPVDVTLTMLCADVGTNPSAGPDNLNGYQRSGVMTSDQPLPEGASVDENGIVHGPNGETWVVMQEEDGWYWNEETGRVEGPDGSYVGEDGIIHGPDGFEAGIYVSPHGDVVVAFAGTGDRGDVITDINQGRGKHTPQHAFAITLGVSMEEQYPGRVIFTGHSLGGGLAATASLATGAPAVTFNAAGINQDTRERAVQARNELEERRNGDADFQERSVDDYVQEADDGNIRSYHTKDDIVNLVNSVPGSPNAIGHPIEIDDSDDTLVEMLNSNPVWQVLSPLTPQTRIAALALRIIEMVGDHLMGPVAEAMLSEDGMPVTVVEGSTVTMATFERRDDGTGVTTLSTVTFADTPEGRQAQRTYEMTGELPADMAGVQSATVGRLETSESFGRTDYSYTEATFRTSAAGKAGFDGFVDGGVLPEPMVGVESVTTAVPAPGDADMSMTTITDYGQDGLPDSGTTHVSDDGTNIVSISHAYDERGNEVTDQRQYTFALTPRSEAEARALGVMFPEGGPYRVGTTYQVTLDETQMQGLRDTSQHLQLLPDEARAEDPQGNVQLAVALATYGRQEEPGEGLIWNLAKVVQIHNESTGEPIDAEPVEVGEPTP